MVWVSHPLWQRFNLVKIFEKKVKKQIIPFNIRQIHVFTLTLNNATSKFAKWQCIP